MTKTQKPKAIVLLSGGIDSSTAAYWVRKDRDRDVIGLTLLYGQRASKEVECAKKIAKAVGAIEHYIINLNELQQAFVSPLTHGSVEPVVVEENDRPGASYYLVPLRNLVFMSIACAMAESYDAEWVVIGAHLDDYAKGGFPDCSPAFYTSLEETVRRGTGEWHRAPLLMQPWRDTSKHGIIAKGLELGVNYVDTWSCYLNSDKPCGICESCIYRKEAFELNGTEDPLEYDNV